jgi:Signal transduction histidine kinase
MRLRKRILVSIILCLLLPLLLIAVVVWLILHFQVQLISANYNTNTNMVEIIQNSPTLFEGLVKDDFNELLKTVETTPQLLSDRSWLEERNRDLKDKFSFLSIREDGEMVYVGDEDFYETMAGRLPEYRGDESTEGKSMFLEGESHALIRQIDYRTAEGKEATLFLITDINHLLPQWRRTLVEALIALLIALVITTFIVVKWLYRSIVRPLTELSHAANQISEGNLDGEVSVGKKDEIGQLQQDFESMRQHLKELSEQRLRYQQEAREMISNISHDMKTPLTAIKGYSEGLLDGVADTPEKQDRYYRTIYTKAADMERMVDELGFYAKIEQKAMTYDFRVLPIREFLEDCIEELSFDMETIGFEFRYEDHSAPGTTALFDPEHIKRVIINIVGNSIKYMDKTPGRITMTVTEDGEFVWIAVTDNGSGIHKSDIPYVFDRFYRADSSRGTKKGGSGLGLSIVKSIVEAHGGTAAAESVWGEGTTVRFSLPKRAAGVVTGTAEDNDAEASGKGGKRWKKKNKPS